MFSILEEFAYGNIPKDRGFNKNSEYGRAIASAADNEAKLLAKLSGEDKIIFQTILEAHLKIVGLTAKENLVYGYKLGVTMTTEVFVGRDSL